MKALFSISLISCLVVPYAAPAQDQLHPEPRYRIDLIEVVARDETAFDWPGSDEIIVWVDAPTASFIVRGFDDMDSDEAATVVPEGNSCMAPAQDSGAPDGVWRCGAEGMALPIELTFTIYEDDGLPREVWEALFTFQDVGFCLSAGGLGDLSKDCVVDDDTADNLNIVGRYRVTHRAEDLIMQVGETRHEDLIIDSCSEKVTIRNEVCGSGFDFWNGVYRLSLVTTRLPDVMVSDVVDRDVIRDPVLDPVVE